MYRIVVGAGRTPEGAAALKYAAEAVRDGETYLHVVHAVDGRERADLAMEPDLAMARRASRDRIQAWALDVVKDHLGPDASVLVSTLDGPLMETLADEARGAQKIVIGLPTDPRHVDLLEQLVSRCTCPIVVVHADGTPTELTPVCQGS